MAAELASVRRDADLQRTKADTADGQAARFQAEAASLKKRLAQLEVSASNSAAAAGGAGGRGGGDAATTAALRLERQRTADLLQKLQEAEVGRQAAEAEAGKLRERARALGVASGMSSPRG